MAPAVGLSRLFGSHSLVLPVFMASKIATTQILNDQPVA